MTKPNDRKRLRVETPEGVSQAGDNRGASDPDGNKAAGDSKSPGVTEPNDEKENGDQPRPPN